MNTETIVEDAIKRRVESFVDRIEESIILEIAGHFVLGDTIPLGEVKGRGGEKVNSMPCTEECWKIINHAFESAVLVSVDSVIKTPEHSMYATIEALKSGITTKLFGVTRIVGYYSRVANWNASKIGELRDRRQGNYWDTQRRASREKVKLVDE